MSDHELDAMEAVAQAATPGPWQVLDSIHGDPIVHQVGRGYLSGGGVATAFHGEDYGRTVAAHIATFDPPTVLALIERLRKAEAERDEWRAVAEERTTVRYRNAEETDAQNVALRQQVADLTAERDQWQRLAESRRRDARPQREEALALARAEAAEVKSAARAEVIERVRALAESKQAEIERINATPDPLTGRRSTMRAYVLVEDLLPLLADAPTPPAEAETCGDCGHVHTPDGCIGEPTPSDRWAGVSPSACDCHTPPTTDAEEAQ